MEKLDVKIEKGPHDLDLWSLIIMGKWSSTAYYQKDKVLEIIGGFMDRMSEK